MKIISLILCSLLVVVATGCKSRSEDHARENSLDVLGIHTFVVHTKDIKEITLFLEEKGSRSELLSTEVDSKQVVIRIQLGLPEDKMRVAIGNDFGAVASNFASDRISPYPFTFFPNLRPIVGEQVIMETNQDEAQTKNRLIVKFE